MGGRHRPIQREKVSTPHKYTGLRTDHGESLISNVKVSDYSSLRLSNPALWGSSVK